MKRLYKIDILGYQKEKLIQRKSMATKKSEEERYYLVVKTILDISLYSLF